MLQSDITVRYGITSYGALAPLIGNILSRETLAAISIDPLHSRRFIGDLYGLLQSKNIEPMVWPVIMVANRYSSPGEYAGELTLLQPTGSVARQVLSRPTRSIVGLAT